MRVMLLASGDLWAGAEVMVYQLAGGLAGIADVELCVVLLNRARLADELENLGIEVYVVDESTHSFVALIRDFSKIVASFAPNVIHSHRYKENLLAWIVSCGRRAPKLIATQHGMPERVGARRHIKGRLRNSLFFRLLSCRFNRTVLVSEEMRQALVGSYGFTEKNVMVIHNGISVPDDEIHRSGQRLTIGSAGRLFPVKDFSLLVDIARLVTSQSETVDFVLAGDGPQRLILEEKVRRYGLEDRFKFSGHVDDMDVFYRSLDVYINTSVHEGIPMSVLEAMSHGLPVVVPKVGGFPEIVEEGVSGYLVAGRNPKAFAEAILGLLQTDHRRSIAEAARQRVVDCFSREAMARKYYEMYREVVDGTWIERVP